MTIVKQGDTFVLTGVTMGKLMAIANTMNTAKAEGKLTVIGLEVSDVINNAINKEGIVIGFGYVGK